MNRILLMALLTGLFFGCAETRRPQILDPQFATRNLRQLALAPVMFADEPFDRYHGSLAADEIRRQAGRELEKKGYKVVLMADANSGFAGPPIVPVGADLVRIAPAVPPGNDAMVQIRIDHFLDTGLYDERSRIPLDIYATAALIADGQILWQGEGRGQGNWRSTLLGAEDFYTPAAFLAGSLFATLPPPP